ncbi:DUF885 domain-containing protein [Ancrocorticia populi]|uniref:DUF885 domain-containing protein n=1 Tax=Ancrocorticia populi TaxID=2175228 RepID=A0A2V1K7G1_9ACTO|nr:DUF885 domain-containing protein [Ancrocorticia populi]PWF27408.1 DUF885 domain-containing protein [Ancrocorticia populi]
MTTAIDELSNSYFYSLLKMFPDLATSVGIEGGDEGAFPDYSPAGTAAYKALIEETLTALAPLTPESPQDEVGAAALRERLTCELDLINAGEVTGQLNVIECPLTGVRDIFDLMPTDTEPQWETIARRLRAVEPAFAGYKESLFTRLKEGPAFPARQVARCAEQCDSQADPDTSNFTKLAAAGAEAFPALTEELEEAAAIARTSFEALATFLREKIAPSAIEQDGVGRERYERFSRGFLGATVDLDETYEWGKAELARIIAEQEEIATQLYGPGTTVAEAMERLNNDPDRQLHSTTELRTWMQETADGAMEAISGTYFDVPDAMKTMECMVLEDGTGGIYYTAPTDDFSRPGRMWWSVPAGVTDFATWQEKTTVFHEGVPGHHLQLGLATFMRDELNLWRRHCCWTSGHGEGWALYAEQLMAELGFQHDPGDRMGVLDSMRLRAARVVVDLGVHLGKDAGDYGNGPWDHDSAWKFLRENVAMEENFLSFELDRYLGWPGQAPSYKIGQRIWNELREEAKTRAEEAGEEFDMKAWHMKALRLGGLGLDTLAEALR